MRRKKLPKTSAPTSASVNARAAMAANGEHRDGLELEPEERRDPPSHRARVLLAAVAVFAFAAIAWLMFGSSTDGLPGTNFTPDVSNLSILPGMVQESFADFYDANVQPLLDNALFSFNGTNHAVGEEARVGYQLRKAGARAKHPVVLVPGFITSGLELWEGTPCAKKHFRQRLWGSISMARTFFADRECWRRHLALDPTSGMDPENIRLRPAQGFEAADNFMLSYWVWSKLIENLADVGYDGSTMTMMPYDWRLGYEYLEKRDGYFTKLKHTIEAHRMTTGEKVVLVSHSMGGTVVYYFLQWVVADSKAGGGGGGKKWVENNVESFVNIAGTLLGTPKAIPALLSGELKDTAVLLSQLGELLEQYFGRRWRRNLWRTWGSLYGMLPKGGSDIWGSNVDLIMSKSSVEGGAMTTNSTSTASPENRPSPDNDMDAPTIIWNNGTDGVCPPHGSSTKSGSLTLSRNWSMEETVDYLFRNGPRSLSTSSSDSKYRWKTHSISNQKWRHWSDPLATQLPYAPSLKIYCLYGTGIPTERSFHYKAPCDKLEEAYENQSCAGDNYNNTSRDTTIEGDEPPEAPFMIDTSLTDDLRGIQNGIQFSDGDGSVPLISLGLMCQKWSQRKNRHNPSGVKVYTREVGHDAHTDLTDPGHGGPSSGEHVDILGNTRVIEDVVRVATGFEVQEKINQDILVSGLKELMQRIEKHN